VNPFDLRGPEFLLFYLGLMAVALLVVWLWRRRAEDGPVPRGAGVDPYAVAYLRGGAAEAIRVAVLSLHDRGLLTVTNGRVTAVPGAATKVRRQLERAVLQWTEEGRWAYELPANTRLQADCSDIERELRDQRLIPGPSHKATRMTLIAWALLVVLGVAGIKVLVALGRGRHNVGFLIVLAIFAALLVVKLVNARRTTIGDRYLADLRHLFGGLRARALDLPAGGTSSEMAFLAGVFGLSALAGVHRDRVKELFPRAAATTSSSAGASSCGSSCGSSGGSSCGGGGCGGGGCGGCGS
jgi:uncharacterized protein (TIGR04222 family)